MPRAVARLVRAEPQLVSAAVEACYYRTPQEARAAARARAFPPADLVDTSVRLSRCQYAQLLSQQVGPPKGWPLPLPSAPDFRAADLGLKLAQGFELVCGAAVAAAAAQAVGQAVAAADQGAAAPGASAAAAADGQAATADGQAPPAAAASAAAPAAAPVAAAAAAAPAAAPAAPAAAPQPAATAPPAAPAQLAEAQLEGSPAWGAFRASLDASGYFRGELPGSQLHRQLLAAALQAFAGSAAYSAATQRLSRPAERALQILSVPEEEEGEGQGQEGGPGLGLPGRLLPEDDDSWLTSWGEGLEDELLRREQEQQQEQQQGGRRSSKAGAGQGAAQPGPREVEVDAADVAERLRDFVGHLASFEGAEVPAAAGGQGAAAKAGGEDVSLDMRAFLSELQKVLGSDGGGGGGAGGRQRRRRQQQQQDPLYADLEGVPGQGDGSDDDEEEQEQEEQEATSSEGSSFYDGSETSGSDEEEEEEQEAAAEGQGQRRPPPRRPPRPSQSQLQAGCEVLTATDSDDDEAQPGPPGAGAGGSETEGDDGDFLEAYDLALRAELAGTDMAHSFERPPGAAGAATAAAAGAAAGPGGGEQEEEEMLPVDVDLNLVKSLVESFGAQQGLPGPAGNLAGLLGLQLPADGGGGGGGGPPARR